MPGISPAIRSVLQSLSRAVSRFVVRPEADRLLRLLGEPVIESAAYTNRALRDLEARVGGGAGDLAAMHAFRALHDLKRGHRVLLGEGAPALLEAALESVGCTVSHAPEGGVAAASTADFDAVIAIGESVPPGWVGVQTPAAAGPALTVARPPR